MSFDVHTDALRTANTQLQGMSGDVVNASTYAHTYLNLDRGDAGIFQTVIEVNDSVREALDGLFPRLTQLTHASGQELCAAARMYDDTDEATRERMDGQYQRVEVAPGDSYEQNHSTGADTVPEKPDDYEPPPGIPGDGSEPPSGGGGGGGSW